MLNIPKYMFQQLTTLQSYNFREKETHQAGTFTKIIPTPVAQPESNEPLASDHRDSYWAVPQTTPQHSTCWTLHWGDAARESGPFPPFRLHRGRPWTSRNSGLFGWWPRSFDLPFWRNIITNNMPTSFGKEMRSILAIVHRLPKKFPLSSVTFFVGSQHTIWLATNFENTMRIVSHYGNTIAIFV